MPLAKKCPSLSNISHLLTIDYRSSIINYNTTNHKLSTPSTSKETKLPTTTPSKMSTEPSVDIDNLPKGQEFHASKPGSEPMMTGGHQPGYKVPDDVPTSHLEVHPPGTAPADKSFTPQVGSEVEPQVDTSKLEETAQK